MEIYKKRNIRCTLLRFANFISSIIWDSKKKLISIYKCFSLLKHAPPELKSILFADRKKLKGWLVKWVNYFGDYGLRESKKGRKGIAEILGYQ